MKKSDEKEGNCCGDPESWNVVSKKDKKRRAKRRGNPNSSNSSCQSFESSVFYSDKSTLFKTKPINDEDKTKCKQKIQNLLENLGNTDFCQSLMSQFMLDLQQDELPSDMVCYGIGNFSKSPASLWQFSCMIHLKEKLALHYVYYYDPCTTALELEIVTDYQILTISRNERGMRPVSVPTLFFMPHCPQRLYNNVLVSNWKSLHMISIFGNSLHAYKDNLINQGQTVKLCKGIQSLLPFITETKVTYSKRDRQEHYQLEAAFNDCCRIQIRIPSDSNALVSLSLDELDAEDDDQNGEIF